MPAPRVAVVLRIISRQAKEGAVARLILQRAARAPEILVVVVLPRGEIGAEPTPAQPRDRSTNSEPRVADRRARADDAVCLVIAAIGPADAQRRIHTDPPGHVFHGTADRVATVKRALRPAQHLDPLNVVDIKYRGLRTVEIDVVEIDADACLEPGNRILLADAANEGRQRRIGAARRLERDVRGHIGQIGDVERTRCLELRARKRGDRDRHVEQPFLAAACRNDDIAVDSGLVGGGPDLRGVGGAGGGLRLRGCGSRKQCADCHPGVQHDHHGFRLCHGVIPSAAPA